MAKGKGMNVKQLLQTAKESHPALRGLPDEAAQKLVRQVFAQIRDEVDATREGVLRVRGLGGFRVRQVKRKRDGTTVKRVLYVPVKSE
jgi:hypothetical protein